MSKEILLISPPDFPSRRGINQPLGIASIAGYLEKNGYDGKIELIDGCYLSQKFGVEKSVDLVTDRFLKDQSTIVGCSIYHSNETVGFEITERARKAGMRVIVGGHYATVAHHLIAQFVTAVVRQEGEVTSKSLIDALFSDKNFYGIEGVTFHDGKEVIVNPDRRLVDFDELPIPALHLLPPMSEYDNKVSIEESRGCIYNCSFCSISPMYQNVKGKSYRLKSPERIKIEVDNAHELGATKIRLIGELALLDKERALMIADIMNEFGYRWEIDAHPRLIIKQKDILPELQKKGLELIETGIESANQRGLDVYNKQTTPQVNEKAIQAMIDSGILPGIDFINFNPYTTMEDLEQNINFIIRHFQTFAMDAEYPESSLFHKWSPVPGTTLYERARKDGLLVSNDEISESFKFRDEKVGEVLSLVDYFKEKYGVEYHKMQSKAAEAMNTLGDRTSNASSKMLFKRAHFVASTPVEVLWIAHASVSRRLSGRDMIDVYCQQKLPAIESGNYDYDVKMPSLE